MRLGLVGYGAGGRFFHAPFIVAADGVELVGVVTRSPRRRAELAADHPGTPVFDSLSALIAAGVDAVTITTPPQTRRDLVLEAVAAGVHVIADKPFAPTADGGRLLVAAAAKAAVVLNVFHNRRWDADIRTLAAVLARGDIGELWRVESRFDADDAATLEAGPEGGLLRDIGSHLVDQVLWLLGPAQSVYAELEWVDLPEGRTDCGFSVAITHIGGVHSRVSSTKLNRIEERELRAYGSVGGVRRARHRRAGTGHLRGAASRRSRRGLGLRRRIPVGQPCTPPPVRRPCRPNRARTRLTTPSSPPRCGVKQSSRCLRPKRCARSRCSMPRG